MARPTLDTIGEYALRALVATLAACFAGNVAFALMLVVEKFVTHGRNPFSAAAIVLIFGTLISFLPCAIVMTALVAMRARPWWAYVAGGIVAAVAINSFAASVNATALIVTVIAGAVGGLAAWHFLGRLRMA